MVDTPTTPVPNTAARLARPQPLGAFPLPLGYLLVPAGADTEAARAELLAGRVPTEWPAALRAHELALAGDREGAVAALGTEPADPVTRYNRFVLDPDGENPDELRRSLGEFSVLVDVVLFTLGRTEQAPPVGSADGELAALVLSAQASQALLSGDPRRAVELLDRAAEHAAAVAPTFAGTLHGAAASILLDRGDQACVPRFERALELLSDATALRVGRAELHLGLAVALHDQAAQRPDLLRRAVPHYHSALQLVQSHEAPLTWAGAHAGLATAYLTMPMTSASDQLRLAVATRSLRAALTVYTREDHPAQWASAQLNLANALVCAPSSHRAENLAEAVEIYQALLELRDRGSDPLGRARVLANQGNALVQLGCTDEATARLSEARVLFEEHGDTESAHAVRELLDEIACRSTPEPVGHASGGDQA